MKLYELAFWVGFVCVLVSAPLVIAHVALPAHLFTVPPWGLPALVIGILLMLVAYFTSPRL